MADIADVLAALVQIASNAVYPNGTGQASVTAKNIRCFAGWPDADTLNADLKAGNAAVSVFPRPEERNLTRYPLQWQDQTVNAPTLTLIVAGQTVTVGGTVSIPQAAVVTVNGTAYSYGVQATDTLATIAAGIAALIPGASAVGAVVTTPSAKSLIAAVSQGGTSIKEVRRQERVIQVTVWADTPAHRDTIAQAVDVALAQSERIALPDTTVAHMVYKGSPMTDEFEKLRLYRRDLMYTIEYATTITQSGQTVVGTVLNVTPQNTFNSTVALPNLTSATE